MRFAIIFALVATPFAAALDFTGITEGQSFSTGSTIDLTWDTVNTDPTTFSLYLWNFVVWPPFYAPLEYNIDTSDQSVSVTIPCDVDPSSDYQFTAINGTNVYVIYAQTPKFIIQGNSCSSPTLGSNDPSTCPAGTTSTVTVTVSRSSTSSTPTIIPVTTSMSTSMTSAVTTPIPTTPATTSPVTRPETSPVTTSVSPAVTGTATSMGTSSIGPSQSISVSSSDPSGSPGTGLPTGARPTTSRSDGLALTNTSIKTSTSFGLSSTLSFPALTSALSTTGRSLTTSSTSSTITTSASYSDAANGSWESWVSSKSETSSVITETVTRYHTVLSNECGCGQ